MASARTALAAAAVLLCVLVARQLLTPVETSEPAYTTLSDPLAAPNASGEVRILVVFSPEFSADERASLLESTGTSIALERARRGTFELAIASSEDPRAVLEALRHSPGVLLAEPLGALDRP